MNILTELPNVQGDLDMHDLHTLFNRFFPDMAHLYDFHNPHMSRNERKCLLGHVCPAMTQINLHIFPVWSVSSHPHKEALYLQLSTEHTEEEILARADLSLPLAYMLEDIFSIVSSKFG